MPSELPNGWDSRWLFERGLSLIYLVAFLVTANQALPLIGDHGLLPAARFIEQIPFRYAPSVFYAFSGDLALRACAWAGVALSLLALSGIADRGGAGPAAIVWALLYVLYLSF